MSNVRGGKFRQRGFTLIELAVSTVIISIMMTAGLKLLAIKGETSALQETRDKQLAIRQALVIYLSNTGKLPCPAIAKNGLAAPSCPGNEGIPDNQPSYVPYKTINLSKESAVDGWGNEFMYYVDSKSTSNSILDSTDAIEIKRYDALCSPGSFSNVAERKVSFVVESNGRNGKNRMLDGCGLGLGHMPFPDSINLSTLDSFDNVVSGASKDELYIAAHGRTIKTNYTISIVDTFNGIYSLLNTCNPAFGAENKIFDQFRQIYNVDVGAVSVLVSTKATATPLFSISFDPLSTLPPCQ